MAPRIRTVIINADESMADRVIGFWRDFLEVELQSSSQGITWLQPDTPGGVNVGVQTVDLKQAAHPEMHLDILVDDLDEAERRVLELGGATLARNRLESGFEWRVLADPDGNRFCVFVE